MSAPASLPAVASYRALVALPHAAPAFAATALARFGYGAVSLALLLDVRARTGSFRLAGLVVGGFAVAAVTMPVKARLIDRHGQRRVLPALGAGCGALVLAVTVLPVGALVPAGVLAGVAAPPVGPSMRARWSRLTADTARARAFALDAVAEEALYVVSPAAAGGLAALAPGLALAVAASTVALGAVGLGLAPGAPAAARHPVDTTRAGVLAWRPPPGIGPGLAVAALFGLGTATLEFAVAARALTRGDAGWTGVLLSAVSVGSVGGGLLWGRRPHRRGAAAHLVALATWCALGCVAAAVTGPTVALGAVLAVTGLAVSPLLVVVYVAVDARTTPGRHTEANTWIGTLLNLGTATGSGLGGLLVAPLGAAWLTAAAAVPLLTATVFARRLSGGGSRTVRG